MIIDTSIRLTCMSNRQITHKLAYFSTRYDYYIVIECYYLTILLLIILLYVNTLYNSRAWDLLSTYSWNEINHKLSHTIYPTQAFQGYQEGFPNFNPTFGYKPGFKSGPQPGVRQRMQMNSRGKKKDYDQYPSWSDRILWRRKGNG
jgi:hypothetical protein